MSIKLCSMQINSKYNYLLRTNFLFDLKQFFNYCSSSNVGTSLKDQVNQNKKAKFAYQQPEHYNLFGNSYKTDHFTNITPTVLNLLKRKLYKEKSSPIYLISSGIEFFFKNYESFEFENPIVTINDNFDSLLIPKDHASRSKSDTYYINNENLLRCHTSAHQAQMLNLRKKDKFKCIADVYRRDVIDSTHYPAFHQCEIFNILDQDELPNCLELFDKKNVRTKEKQENYTLETCKETEKILKFTVESYIKFLFGKQIEMRWIPAYFPFTHPSFELEIFYANKWIEILGCGIVERQILLNSNIQNRIAFAIGFGLERLAMIKYKIPDIRLFWSKDSGFISQFKNKLFSDQIEYKPISAYPQSYNDCSFWIDTDNWSENDFHDIVREIGGDLIEQVYLIDNYTNKKGRRSNCFRIIYRSNERTLTKIEVNKIHKEIEKRVSELFDVEIRS